MYKVFQLEDGKWAVFWCPSGPVHFSDKIRYDDRSYPQRSAAYRRLEAIKRQQKKSSAA